MQHNWYKIARIQQQAELSGLSKTLISAIFAVLAGWTTLNAAKQFGVNEEEIEQAMSNPNVMAEVQSQDPTEDQMQQERDKTDQEYKNTIKNIMARTLYAEGKNESYAGMKAIASVIYNRAGSNDLNEILKAIKAPKQFSCWNSADNEDWTNMKQGKNNSAWNNAMQIAEEVVNGTFAPSGTWSHYYNPSLCDPYWAYTDKSKTQLRSHKDIGRHRFMQM